MNKQPYIAKHDKDEGVFKCPNFGDYLPKNWEMSDEYFVDNSGFGSESEPALTPNQFINRVRKGFGYAISGEGQFQVYIKEFKRV